MRFTALSVINIVSLIVGTAIADWGARRVTDMVLVAMTGHASDHQHDCFWLTAAWVPGNATTGGLEFVR